MPLGIEPELDPFGETIDVWFERAEFVAESLGQHRDDAIDEVSRVAALLRLSIEQGQTLETIAREIGWPLDKTRQVAVARFAVSLEGDFGPLDQLMRQKWPFQVTVQGEIAGKMAVSPTTQTV